MTLIVGLVAITLTQVRGLPDQFGGCDVAVSARSLPHPVILAIGHGEDGATRLALGRLPCVRLANIVPAPIPQAPGWRPCRLPRV